LLVVERVVSVDCVSAFPVLVLPRKHAKATANDAKKLAFGARSAKMTQPNFFPDAAQQRLIHNIPVMCPRPCRGGVEETLAYYIFLEEHWRLIRPNDPLERILRKSRRRTTSSACFLMGSRARNLAAPLGPPNAI